MRQHDTESVERVARLQKGLAIESEPGVPDESLPLDSDAKVQPDRKPAGSQKPEQDKAAKQACRPDTTQVAVHQPVREP
jgi:hypothetical protein